MTPEEMEQRIVRYGDLVPCKTAFIDAHTPGSDQKENFTVIGAGVSESPDQHVHIRETPGFNIGAAGQPPKCRNSLHLHRTAEVFYVHKGRWRFFWGRFGNAGEVVLEEGDLFDIPTGIFRGFENIGDDYGMIMAVLGGDDAGGGVVWAPQVLDEAKAHGLVLAETGKLYDTRKGETLPVGVEPMQPLDEATLATIPEPTAQDVVPGYVARYWDMKALSAASPATVIGAETNDTRPMIKDRPGFTIDFLQRGQLGLGEPYTTERHEILMAQCGHWRLTWTGGTKTLAPGDVCAVPPGLERSLAPTMAGDTALFRVRNTDDPAGPTRH